MGDRFLIHARQELEKGNRLQAGNKAYGAVVQYLKVIADSRGWNHTSNEDIRATASQIAAEFEDYKLAGGFGEIYWKGHQNYYENSIDQEEVSEIVETAADLLPKLREIASSPPREFEIESSQQLRHLQRLTGDRSLEKSDKSSVGFSNKHSPPDSDSGPHSGTPVLRPPDSHPPDGGLFRGKPGEPIGEAPLSPEEPL